MLTFSNSTDNSGLVQQVRSFARVDANQWPTYKIMNSCNNYLDTIAGYAINTDKRFQWDSTNHSKMPVGTTDLIINQNSYSFLTDEQGNNIVTLLGISRLDSATGKYIPLTVVDRSEVDTSTFGTVVGTPTQYDKVADNIIKLDTLPPATISAGLRFEFQRTPYYFVVTDTTRSTGFSPLLDRGFVIASAYDCALTLGLKNLQPLSIELQKEEKKMVTYFSDRNNDEYSGMKPKITSSK